MIRNHSFKHHYIRSFVRSVLFIWICRYRSSDLFRKLPAFIFIWIYSVYVFSFDLFLLPFYVIVIPTFVTLSKIASVLSNFTGVIYGKLFRNVLVCDFRIWGFHSVNINVVIIRWERHFNDLYAKKLTLHVSHYNSL